MPRCCHSMPVRQRGAGEPGVGPRPQPAASPKLCREPDGRRPPAAPGGGRAGGARAGGAQHRRACGPSACPLQRLPEGAPAPCTGPQKRCRRRPQPAAGPKLCREPDGRRPPAACGGGRAGGARAGGVQHRRACGPVACPLQELSEGAARPMHGPAKTVPPPTAACRKVEILQGAGRPQAARRRGRRARGRSPRRRCLRHRRACGPSACPLQELPRGRLPHTQAHKKRGALRLPRKCDQILMPSSAILSRSERKSAKPFWVLAGLRSSAAGWKVPIIQTPFFSAHSPCWRVTL